MLITSSILWQLVNSKQTVFLETMVKKVASTVSDNFKAKLLWPFVKSSGELNKCFHCVEVINFTKHVLNAS